MSSDEAVSALWKVVETRFKIRAREINKARDIRYKTIAGQNFAGGCLGRAAKRLEVLEEYATRKALEYAEIYKAVGEEFGSVEMFADDQLTRLASTIESSIHNECGSVKEMSERDCKATGNASPSAIKALAARYPSLEAYIVEAGKDQVRLLQTENAARHPLMSLVDIERAAAQPSVTETVAYQLSALRDELRMPVAQLGRKIGIDQATVYRHLEGRAIPQLRIIGAYESFFSKALDRKVVILSSPKKRK